MSKNLNSKSPYLDPIINIITGLDGKFVYSPDFNTKPTDQARLAMSGKRSEDRNNLLEILSKTTQEANKCHCHHTYSYSYDSQTGVATADMQLVPAKIHIKTYPHAGAVRQWNSSGNHSEKYREIRNTNTVVTSLVKYSESEIEEFENEMGVQLPEELKCAYLNQTPVQDVFHVNDESNSDEIYCVSELLLLHNDSMYENVPTVKFVIDVLKENGISIYRSNFPYEPIPYATDPCGNVFYTYSYNNTDYYFIYDHEYDEYYNLY